VPLFALGGAKPTMDISAAVLAILTILGVIVAGRFLLSRLYRFVAATGVREAMTASALLTVVGVALVMQVAGLSPALGSFIAGALLADSEYRHQIEADIAPFEGLLLAVFFIAVGMSIDIGVLVAKPGALHDYFRGNPEGRSPLEFLRDLRRVPAAIFVVDTRKEHLAMAEAERLDVPIMLPLGKAAVGSWWYRVRGINPALPVGADAMTWSKPVRLRVTGDRFVVVK